MPCQTTVRPPALQSPVSFGDGLSDAEERELLRFFSQYLDYRESIRECEEWLNAS